MDPTHPELRVPERIGRYVDLSVLGRGGMGAVYRAYDPELDRPVAIKVMLHSTPDFVARFRREAQAIARLTHANVVQVFDFGVDDDGDPYFVMELVEGTSVDQLLCERSRLSEAAAISIARQAAQGLAAAHRAGIIHRDVKPSNLIVDARGNVKLVDFGIARASSGVQLTKAASLMGTPGYMAPEQAQGKSVDARADVYALGLTLFEMLAGEAPFQADEPLAVVVMNIHDPLPDLRLRNLALSEGVVRLVEQMGQKDPAARPQSCEAVVRRLDALDAVGAAPIALGTAGAFAAPSVASESFASGSASPSIPSTNVYPTPSTAVASTRRGLGLALGTALAVGGIGIALLLVLKPATRGEQSAGRGEPVGGTSQGAAQTRVEVGRLAQRPTSPVGPDPTPPALPSPEPSVPAAGPLRRTDNGAGHLVGSGPLRIAVLKFQNLARDMNLEGLALGIGETAISDLAGTAAGRLEVLERSDLESDIGELDRRKDDHFDKATVAQAGKLEGVHVAVQGGFQRAGNVVRVTARFVRVQTGEILDTVRVDGKARQVLALQDEVARVLREHLVTLVDRERPIEETKGATPR